MGFNDNLARVNNTALARFANCTVTPLLHGTPAGSFRAIFDDSVEVINTYETEQIMFKPGMTALSTDITEISAAGTFDILRDGDSETKRYAFDGKPRPDGAGLTRVFLAVKK